MKYLLKRLFRKFGVEVSLLNGKTLGRNHLKDMARFVQQPSPFIFDVGANEGQSITRFRSAFPQSVIHSFEPSPKTFNTLKLNFGNQAGLHLWNFALGAARSELMLLENSLPYMNSFLAPGSAAFGNVVDRSLVPVKTIDQFCSEQSINKIDILKSDTQGFDLEVLKGANQMLRNGEIALVFCEITFCDLYKEIPSVAQIYEFLMAHDFALVSFYGMEYHNQLAGWTDALFVHKSAIELAKGFPG